MPPLLRRLKASAAPVVKRGLSDAAAAAGLYRLAARAFGGVGVILMLHRVIEPGRPNLYPSYMTDTRRLEAALRAVRRAGWDPVDLDEVARRLEEGEVRRRFVCFTADDGYRDNLELALPLFRKYQVPLAVYLCPGILDRTVPYWWGAVEELVLRQERIEWTVPDESGPRVLEARTWPEKQAAHEALDALGHRHGPEALDGLFRRYGIDPQALLERDALSEPEARDLAADPLVIIGAHSMTHERLSRLDADAAARQIRDGRTELERRLGIPVRHLAYPFGGGNACGPREFGLAKAAGYRTAVTTRPGNLFLEHRSHLECLPRRALPDDRVGLRHALTGYESRLRRQPPFQTA